MARYLLAIFLLIAIGAGLWWVLLRNQAKRAELLELTSQAQTAVPVTTAPVRQMTLRDSFQVNGTFEPWQQAVVVPTLSGQVERLRAQPGDLVRPDQVLLEIDNAYTRNDLEAAEITLAQARKDVERMENLIGDGGVTRRQYEEAQAKVESAEVKLRSLRQRIGDARVRAPIPGYVTPIPRNPLPVEGGFVGQGKPVFMLVDISRLHLRVLLTAEQVRSVQAGQRVQVASDLFPDSSLTGKVAYIGMTTDFLSKRYPVDIEVPNAAGHPLRGGMNGRATFGGETMRERLVVPSAALRSAGAGQRAFVVEAGRARARDVRTGAAFGGFTEVLGGLRAGERVVLSGQINLTDNAEVTERSTTE